MNKLAYFVEHYSNLGRQAAIQDIQNGHTKTAGIIPSSRMGKALLGAAGLGGGLAAYKATRPEPSALENMYEGGKDMLSNMSQEDLMGYANLLSQLQSGGGGYSMGYNAGSPSPSDYAMQDLGDLGGYAAQDPYATMGYEAGMSPEEMQQYMAYYGS